VKLPENIRREKVKETMGAKCISTSISRRTWKEVSMCEERGEKTKRLGKGGSRELNKTSLREN